MSAEFYQTTWLILIVTLWAGFFFLEGFDFGIGILLPFLGKNDDERRLIINSIGPHWDGNEVWLLTAGGATFAAFPHWYATLFSGFYIPLFLLLIGLIVRGVAFEFRSKDSHPRWRSLWDWCIFSGSLLPAVLFGVAFANMAAGVPIDANKIFTGNLVTLLNPFGLLGGLSMVAVLLFHGINFLNMKLSGDLLERTRSQSKKVWLIAFVFMTGSMIAEGFISKSYAQHGWGIVILPLISFISLLAAGITLNKKHEGWTFAFTGLTVLLIPIIYFFNMFPRVMISSTDLNFSLTIQNASSSSYTLTVMSIVALIFLPLVLGYQIWSYWVFRKRVVSEKLTY